MDKRRVYQSGDGRWIYWDGETKRFYNTRREAYLAMALRKEDFALATRAAVTALAEAAERIAELDVIYSDSGYDSGGANPITDEDLTGHDMVAQDLANASTFATNLALFLDDGDPMVFNYASAINKFRNM